MSRYVMDACTAVKWFLPEEYRLHAKRLAVADNSLLVPDLLFSELGNILWKNVRAGRISREEARIAAQNLANIPLVVSPTLPLMELALAIALDTNRTVYDSLYVALAVQEQAPMVTADLRLYNALQGTRLASSLLWIENVP